MNYKQEYKNRFRILKGGLISLVVASNLYGAPSGGTVVSGNATINQSGNTTNINQSSNKAVINWQDFSIKSNETVNFNQPNQNSITLNRVIGNEKSIIDGALNANGQVWLINSNGVLFGKNAKVNTAGIVASTKDISNEDFNKGDYNFKGNSNASIVNEGEIKSLSNTHATFIANSVTNKGIIEVHKGTINLVGASDVTFSLNDNKVVNLKVNKGVLDALVENNNLLIANGGNVYLTTNAKNELLKGVVNNSGIIEANSLDDLGQQSEVIIFAHGGTANISGTINAKGGFVETSGKNLNVTNESKIVAKEWLIDPVNVTIDNSNGTVGNEKVGATIIQNSLNSGTSVTIQADNDINVNETILYAKSELSLNAGNDININKQIDVTGTGGLSLVYAQASGNTTGDYNVNAKVNLANGTTFKTKKGSDGEINWTVVTANDFYTTLNANISGNYVLGKDLILNGTNNWTAIGDNSNKFTGKFDGLGHTISNLNIDKSSVDYQGLFGYTNNALIRNIGLVDVNVTGHSLVGGLVGVNNNSTISNSYATGTVSGNYGVGGLVGYNYNNSTISNSYATGTVIGDWYVGGLVGINDNLSTISNSYATGIVSGINDYVGGLVGINDNLSTISNSFYDNEENTATMGDSSLGKTKAQILTAFNGKTGWITSGADVAGYSTDTISLPQLKTFYKPINTLFQSGYGTSTNPYTITNWTHLQNINNANIVTSGYSFNLINSLSNQTSDYTNLASNTANGGLGWNSIGKNENRALFQFDGLGNTISDLYINRPSEELVGLFGHTQSGSDIQNIGLLNVNITGEIFTGGLVGANYFTNITNSYVTGTVSGNSQNIGGLAGYNSGTISNSYFSGTVSGNNYVGGLVGNNWSREIIKKSFFDSTKYSGNGVGLGNSTGVTGKTTAELEDINTFLNAGWTITADSSLAKGTPTFKNGSWVIGTKVTPTPTPTPTPNSEQKLKVDENVQRVVASIAPSVDSSLSSNQENSDMPNSLNSDIRTLSFNGANETRVINGGVRIPDSIVNSLDELKNLED